MAARLGDVIYWAMCGLAALALTAVGFVLINPGSDARHWIFVYCVFAFIAWLFGRAVRYVLGGR